MSRRRHIDVHLVLRPDQVLHYYSGAAGAVLARSLDGRTVSFPADVLPRLVTEQGVNGVYRLVFDDDNRLREVLPLEQKES